MNITIFDCTKLTGFEILSNIGENFCLAMFTFCPMGISGRPQDCELECDDGDDVILRRGDMDSGSVKSTAVAGTVLGTKNPELIKDDENTDKITAPGIPITRVDTSARTTGF